MATTEHTSDTVRRIVEEVLRRIASDAAAPPRACSAAASASAPAPATRTAPAGTLAAPTPATGVYEATFHVGEWYRAQKVALPSPAFLETVPYRFGVADLAQHYHLPLKMTPWGFSLFRGGE